MSVSFKQLIDYIINEIEVSRLEKYNKYYVVSDVVQAINQLENIRKFYHSNEDNKAKILYLINKIFEKDGIANPAKSEIMYAEIEQLIINIYNMIK